MLEIGFSLSNWKGLAKSQCLLISDPNGQKQHCPTHCRHRAAFEGRDRSVRWWRADVFTSTANQLLPFSSHQDHPTTPTLGWQEGQGGNRRAWWEDLRQVRGEYVLITEISLRGRCAKYKSLQSYLLWPILHTAEWSLKFKSNPLTPLLKTFQGLEWNSAPLHGLQCSHGSGPPSQPPPSMFLFLLLNASTTHTYFPFIRPANFFPSSGHSAPVGPHSLESYCPATPGLTPSQPSCLYLNIPPQRLTSKNVQISFSHL